MNPDLLSKELLAELPDQLVKYMQIIGKNPQPPQFTDIDKMAPKNVILN